MALQLHCPLISLPGELKNEIFKHALSSTTPIVNPYYQPSTRPKHRQVPPLGASLSQTCRTIHTELDMSSLYRNNSFTFTRISHIHAFYKHLTREQMRWIRSITIDLREASASYANDGAVENADIIGNEWLHYLSCNHYAHAPGAWCSQLPTMSSDLPDVKELVLDLTAWQSPFAGTRRSGWSYLQRLLGSLKGMESISLKGKCLDSSFWNPTPSPWSLAPWFSPAFCNDNTSLLDLLGAGVRDAGTRQQKVFVWKVDDGITTLEVKIVAVTARNPVSSMDFRSKVPDCGMAAWEAFLDLKGEKAVDLSPKVTPSTSEEDGATAQGMNASG